MTRIVSWNVNGIRAAHKKGFLDWLDICGAEVVALQETRALAEQLPAALLEPAGWHLHLQPAQKKGYSGVALYSRRPPEEVRPLGIERFDIEGRLQLARFGEWTLVNGYFPNGSGKNRDHSRVPYKLDFYRALFDALESRRAAGERILVMGDMNTAHQPIDLARPKQNEKTSGFLPEERDELDRWLRAGWVDTFRSRYPDTEGAYSWWSNRGNVRERNIGWRIDYVLASPAADAHVRDAGLDADVMGSDHCPVWVTIDPAAWPAT